MAEFPNSLRDFCSPPGHRGWGQIGVSNVPRVLGEFQPALASLAWKFHHVTLLLGKPWSKMRYQIYFKRFYFLRIFLSYRSHCNWWAITEMDSGTQLGHGVWIYIICWPRLCSYRNTRLLDVALGDNRDLAEYWCWSLQLEFLTFV